MPSRKRKLFDSLAAPPGESASAAGAPSPRTRADLLFSEISGILAQLQDLDLPESSLAAQKLWETLKKERAKL